MTGRSARDGTREKWRRAVLASELADAVKVTLIAKSLWMTDKGYVSVPRETIAALLDKHPRKIGEHVAAAVRAGYLAKIDGGYRGVTARYVAIIPNPKGGRLRGTNRDEICCETATFIRPPFSRESAGKVAASGVPITRASVSQTRRRDVHERDVRVSRNHVLTDKHRRGEVERHSAVAAVLRKFDGRRPVCTALRGAA